MRSVTTLQGSLAALAVDVPGLMRAGKENISDFARSYAQTQRKLRSIGNKFAVEKVIQSEATLSIVALATERNTDSADIPENLALFNIRMAYSEDHGLNRRYMYRIFDVMMPILVSGIEAFDKFKFSCPSSPSSRPRSDLQSHIVHKDPANVDSGVPPAKRSKTVDQSPPNLAPVAGPSARKPLVPLNKPVVRSKPKPKQPQRLFITKEFNKTNGAHYPALPETSRLPIPAIEGIQNARRFATHQLEVQAAKAAQPEKRKRY